MLNKKEKNSCEVLSCFSRATQKKAAADWTVGKLLSIILLVVFLVLVIYGVSVNGLNPLIERAGGMVDQVLLLFGVGDKDTGIAEGDCNYLVLAESGGGWLLDALELEGDAREKVVLEICRSGGCMIQKTGIGDYFLRSDDGELYEAEGKEMGPKVTIYDGSSESQKFSWEFYSTLMDLSDNEGKFVETFFEDVRTDQIILYGDGEGSSRENWIYAIWQNGFWVVYRHDTNSQIYSRLSKYSNAYNNAVSEGWELLYNGRSNDLALGNFTEVVLADNNDNVYYSITPNDGIEKGGTGVFSKDSRSWGSVENLVGNEKGKANELEEDEVDKFKEKIEKFQKSLLNKVIAKAEYNYSDFMNLLDDEVVNVDGTDFSIKFGFEEERGYFIEATNLSSDEVYRLISVPSNDMNWRLNILGILDNVDYGNARIEKKDGDSWNVVSGSPYLPWKKYYFDKYLKQVEIKKYLEGKCS